MHACLRAGFLFYCNMKLPVLKLTQEHVRGNSDPHRQGPHQNQTLSRGANPTSTHAVQVEIYQHALHLLSNKLSEKLGSALVVRRAEKGNSLLSYLVETGEIVKITNECLDALLNWQNMKVCKTTTKANRIRKLLESEHTKKNCSSASIQRVLQALAEQDEKRKKKKEAEAEQKEEAVANLMSVNAC